MPATPVMEFFECVPRTLLVLQKLSVDAAKATYPSASYSGHLTLSLNATVGAFLNAVACLMSRRCHFEWLGILETQ